ncbi:MAG: GNAT family N-acetyltransferase [Pirellulales bacterium]|nr:GNAT family N-acetyltransferase [Pirellulales bacterium]
MSNAQDSAEFGIWDANSTDDYSQWIAHWKTWPAREVAAHPAYVRLFASETGQQAKAAYWKSPQGSVLYPFVLRPIEAAAYDGAIAEGYHDMVSPYGYGGPFCWGEAPKQSSAFWSHFDKWLADRQVVSEFVRLSLFDNVLLDYPVPTISRLTNVVCPLDRCEDQLWAGVKAKVRRNVNKARREGVTVVCDESGSSSAEFQRIYKLTMNRRQADNGYYFSPDFFRELEKGLAGQFAYFHALRGEAVLSSELVLVSAENIYFFLGGTDTQYYALRPNDLLKYEIMRWGNAQNKKRYVLGGGFEEGDGVFQYKQSFAPDGLVPFCVGRRIHNQQIYDILTAQRLERLPPPQPTFFPTYRAA